MYYFLSFVAGMLFAGALLWILAVEIDWDEP